MSVPRGDLHSLGLKDDVTADVVDSDPKSAAPPSSSQRTESSSCKDGDLVRDGGEASRSADQDSGRRRVEMGRHRVFWDGRDAAVSLPLRVSTSIGWRQGVCMRLDG